MAGAESVAKKSGSAPVTTPSVQAPSPGAVRFWESFARFREPASAWRDRAYSLIQATSSLAFSWSEKALARAASLSTQARFSTSSAARARASYNVLGFVGDCRHLRLSGCRCRWRSERSPSTTSASCFRTAAGKTGLELHLSSTSSPVFLLLTANRSPTSFMSTP